jgi:hypothetical protein
MWPYGCLGRTGWTFNGRPIEPFHHSMAPASVKEAGIILTRWFRGGHGIYFQPEEIQGTFEQICLEMGISRQS